MTIKDDVNDSQNDNTQENSPKITACDEEKFKMLLDLVQKRYDLEIERLNNFESKANNLTGYISLIVGLLVGLGSFEMAEKMDKPHFFIPYFIGIVLLLTSFVFSLYASKIRTGDFFLNTQAMIEKYTDLEIAYLTALSRILGTVTKLSSNIAKLNEKKANNIDKSWYFLIGGLIATSVAVTLLVTVR